MNIAILFNFLLFSTPLYFRFINEELFEFNKMVLVYALTTSIVFFWLFRMVKEKRFIFKKTPLDIPILLFLASQVISTVLSIHPRTSIFGYYSRFNGGLLSTISYILLYYAFVSNIRKKYISGIIVSTLVSAIIVSIYGIMEHFGHSFSCLIVPGLKTFDVSCWKPDVQSRVFATFGQPNWLAAYAITILPLNWILAIQKKKNFNKKILFITSSILLFTVLIFTRSRSGLLGLIVGTLTLFAGISAIFFKNKKELKTAIDFKNLSIIGITLLLIAGIFGTVFTPSVKKLLNHNDEIKTEKNQPTVNRLEVGGTDSGEIRKIVWEGGLKIWKRYPLIGSGVETFAYSYYLDRPTEHNNVSEWNFLYNKAHNELINLLATSGLFGLITYLSIFIAFGIVVIKTILSKKNINTKLTSVAILAGITGLFTSNFFGFSTVTVNLLMFVFFGILMVLNQKENDLAKKYSIKSTQQYISIIILVIITLTTYLKIYNYWKADVLFAQGKNYFASGNLSLGLQKQIEAIKKSPKEALFYDNLSDDYAKVAIELAKTGQATAAASMANEAIKFSDLTMHYNNRHLNFYKTRARVFVTLAQIDNQFLAEAQKTLDVAIALSPTDPKLFYTKAVIELSIGNNELGTKLLQKSLELKPDYEKARWKLSAVYENEKQIDKAIEQLKYILDYISPENQTAKDKIQELEML